MKHTARRSLRSAAFVVAALTLVSGLSDATTTSSWVGKKRSFDAPVRGAVPEDVYAMAGGCYSLAAGGAAFGRAGTGFAATAGGTASPFTFQATDLGSYLLYGTQDDFLSASEGVIGTAGYAATRSQPGNMAGGVALEQTDAAADLAARSAANRAAGRGSAIVAAVTPSELADWSVSSDAGQFVFSLASTNQDLALDADGRAVLVDAGAGTEFDLTLATGCLAYPEIEVNVEGDILGSENSFQEVRGYMDLHLHMMAYEFLGGRARCGRPWHRYGVRYALIDCEDHKPGGEGAVLEQVLSGPGPHNTDGWPTFAGWPRYNSLTHEQVYYKWLERAWRSGLRLFTNLLVDNNQLCKIYPFKRNSCNEMDGVRLQAQRIGELERYIDAQSGGPGEGWFRIVKDPFEARRIINEGKLAVVLGIEVSVPLDCGIDFDLPRCNLEQMNERLDAVYDLGVRQMEMTNKFDNALSGVTGDGGTTGIIVNQGNKGETGSFWRMETCTAADGDAHDKQQMNFSNDAGSKPVTGRDTLVGAILNLFGTTGVAPVYPEGPHCNILGLSPLGKEMIRGMAARGIIFDPDHMGARARTQAMDLIEELEYSGIVSSHGWADDTIYPRVYKAGGIVTPYGGGSSGFASNYLKHKGWSDDRFTFGFGYGADTNGFGAQGGPRGANAVNKVTYPFTGFGGVTVKQQVSGTKTYDVNTSGVAHYGLYADWYQDLKNLGGETLMADMARGPEAYLQMWERAIGIAGDACRVDVADLTDADVAGVVPGMTPAAVLGVLGQTDTRLGSTYAFCMTDDRTATVTFSANGAVVSTSIS